MRLLEATLTHPLLQALGWALLHFVWQGALVALLLAGVLRLLQGRTSNLRYAFLCTALGLMLILPSLTFWRLSGSSHNAEVDEMTFQSAPSLDVRSVSGPVDQSDARPQDIAASIVSPRPQGLLIKRLDSLLPWLICGWLVGVLILAGRMLGGLFYTRRLLRLEHRLTELYWLEKLRHLSRQLRLTKQVRLLESTLVQVPTTIGWWRPVILLPACAFTGLTPPQLELILAHELAHIRRHDYLVNLFQVVIETLFFYHPAVWWVSRQVRIEREHACDDLVVAACGDPIAYARALTRVERLRQNTPFLAVAANGGKLSERILRLIEKSQGSRRPASPFMGLLFVAAFFTSLVGAHTVLTPQPPSATKGVVQESSLPNSAPAGRSSIHPAGGGHPAPGDEMASLIARDETAGEDAEVRRIALTALGARMGTVIVMHPQTGRVYAVVNQEWAVRQSWQPASTIKLVTGAAGVGDQAVEPATRVRVSTTGKALDLTQALALSDNSYFSTLGKRVGAKRLMSYAREFGLGEPTGINYAGEIAGRLPPSLAGSDASRIGAYGEGIETTPIQLATLVAAIANGGTLVIPQVPRTLPERAQFAPQFRRRIHIPREHLQSLAPGMIAAVNYGTGAGAFDPTQSVAGKTGTLLDDKSGVGLFASYAPADDPRLVVVVVTHGQNEHGAAAAGVAGTIYRALNRHTF